MSLRNCRSPISRVRRWRMVCRRWLLAAALLPCASLPAQITSTNQVDAAPEALQVSVEPGEFIGSRQIIRDRIKCGTNEFLLVPPEGMRAEVRHGDTIVLTSRDASFFVTFRVTSPAQSEPATERQMLEWATDHYSYATNIQLIGTSVAGRPAKGVQLNYPAAGASRRLVKALWAPCRQTLLELTLNADADNANAAIRSFHSLLLTLRSNENGKLEAVRFLDRS